MGLTATVGSYVGLDYSTGGHGDKATGGNVKRTLGKILPKPGMPKVPDAPGLDENAMRIAGENAREKQRQRAQQAYGRSDTILTGPLGLIGSAPGQRKSLLGQ